MGMIIATKSRPERTSVYIKYEGYTLNSAQTIRCIAITTGHMIICLILLPSSSKSIVNRDTMIARIMIGNKILSYSKLLILLSEYVSYKWYTLIKTSGRRINIKHFANSSILCFLSIIDCSFLKSFLKKIPFIIYDAKNLKK